MDVNVELFKYIAYTIKTLQQKKLYKRLFVQKIIYLILPQKIRKQIYRNTRTGLYSEAVQRIIIYLEQCPTRITEWVALLNLDIASNSTSKNDKYVQKIDKLVEWIYTNDIDQKDLITITKAIYIIYDVLFFEFEK